MVDATPPQSAADRPPSSELLFLAHRIPYPPDKGDKIRSYHLLKHLAGRYRVHLGAFVDDPDDWRHREAVDKLCASVKLVGIQPLQAKVRSLSGLLTGEALSLRYYRNGGMAAWVEERLRAGVGHVLVYSSAMAQFVMHARGARRIMDFVDMDSDKWRQYAATKAWPLSWLYRREGRRLLDWERQVACSFDAGLFVSAQEALDFKRAVPEAAARVDWYGNGVDTDYFSPRRVYDNPYPQGELAMVFTGAMDYWPNVDAVTWFAQDVLPRIRAAVPQARFYVVGSRPAAEVRALAGEAGIHVTGRVADVRPYLAHARVVVAPIRIARGVQNKVLEGMAMGRTMVVSPQALEGLQAHPGVELLVAADAAQFAALTLDALSGLDTGAQARQRVLDGYAWEHCLAKVDGLLAGNAPLAEADATS